MDSKFEIMNHKSEIKKILLVEDKPEDAEIIQEMVTKVMDTPFEFDCVEKLSTGLNRLGEGGIDVVLLNLSLPDSQGLDTFIRINTQAPDVPIIVITGQEEESLAVRATQVGAQDYVIKEHIDSVRFGCAIRSAMEQHRMHVELSGLELIDALTGLYSRWPFLILGQHYLKLANRTKRGLILFFVKIKGMKKIRKNLGQNDIEQILIDTANVLKQSFRRSDIIGHIGTDEFAIVALEAHKENAEIIITRLQKNCEIINTKENRDHKLSLNIGTAFYDPTSPCSITGLMTRARKSVSDG